MRLFCLSFVLAWSLLVPRFAPAQRLVSVCAPDTSLGRWVAIMEKRLIRYPGCAEEITCLECATVPEQLGGVSLTDYFRQQLPPLQVQALTGMVLLDLNLNAAGGVCCRIIDNLTDQPHAQIKALHLDQVVARMPAWPSARQGQKAVSSSTTLRLVFDGAHGLRAEPFKAPGPGAVLPPRSVADTVAQRYQLPGADCALFPAAAALPADVAARTPHTGRFTPTRQQVAAVEKDLRGVALGKVNAQLESSYYAHYPALIEKQLGMYQRQYFGFYNPQGHPCLFLNFFIERLDEPAGRVPRWLREPVRAYDGGAAFWSIYYDLITRAFYRFQHNSEG